MDDHTEPAPQDPSSPLSSSSPEPLSKPQSELPASESARRGDHVTGSGRSDEVSSLATPPRLTAHVPGTPATARRSRLPLILGILVVCGIVLTAAGLLLYRYLNRDSGQTTITGGVLTATPSGLYFRNTAENIAFVAPATWSRYTTASAQIMVRGGGCSFGVLEQRTNLPITAFADAEARDMKRRHPEASPIVAPRTVARKNGLAFTGAYTDSEGGPMSQTYILIDRGPNVVTLIETATDPTCAQAFANLEDSLHL